MERPDTQVFFIPGLFGFAQLAGHDYFVHLERVVRELYVERGLPLSMEVIPTPPTASLLTRAAVVAEHISRAAGDGPIHLVGHSTGGLDGRLLLSPETDLPLHPSLLEWRGRVQSLVTLNTPHFGTPLAGYFTTVAGTRLLYALSLLTVTSLSVGKLPLMALSSALAGITTLDDKLGIEVKLLDELTAYVLRYVGDEGRVQVGDYLEKVRHDRGGIVQLMPEVMSVFNATVTDHADVRYGCVVTASPRPGPRHLLGALVNPMSALSRAIYAVVQEVTAAHDEVYPYAAPTADEARVLTHSLGLVPGPDTVDGIVPTCSMLRGELLFAAWADHLDVVGHFADDEKPAEHVDWLESGANFRRADFAQMARAIVAFQNR